MNIAFFNFSGHPHDGNFGGLHRCNQGAALVTSPELGANSYNVSLYKNIVTLFPLAHCANHSMQYYACATYTL